MGVQILMDLQKVGNPFLDRLFMFVTDLGSETFYILITTYIFWCISKRLGAKLFVITMLSTYANTILKETFRTERPIYYEGINSIYIESAPGFSFPSGHTQGSTTFWAYLMMRVRNKTIYFLGGTIILLVGFSRLYLRVHWPIDVIGGIIIGLLVFFLGNILIEKTIRIKFNYLTTIILAIIIPNLFLINYASETNIKMTALMTGALFGYFNELRFLDFKEKTKIVKQIIKFVIGITIFLGLKTGLKLLFPMDIVFDYIRYFICGTWATLVAPYVFIKLKLAEKGK